MRILQLITSFILILCFINSSKAATITAMTTGMWNSTSTWNSGTIPTAADEIIIPSGYTITLDGTSNFCNSLTIQSGGNLNMNSSGSNKTLFVGQSTASITFPPGGKQTVVVEGTLDLNSTNTLVISGQLDVKASSVFNVSGTSKIYINGDSGSDATSVTDYLLRIDDNANTSITGGTINLFRPRFASVASISTNKSFYTSTSDNNLIVFQGSVYSSTIPHSVGEDGTTPQLWDVQVNSSSAVNFENTTVTGILNNFGATINSVTSNFYNITNGTSGNMNGSIIMKSTRGIGTIQGDGNYNITNLTIDNASDVQVNTVLTLNCPINFTTGKLRVLNNKLVLGSGVSFSGVSATKYIQTSSTGRVHKTIDVDNTFTYPIGNAAYNPVTVKPITDESTVGIRVTDGQPTNTSAGYVSRQWEIVNETGGGTVEADVTLQWDASQEDATFSADRNNAKMYYFDGATWQVLAAGGPSSSSGSTYTKLATNTTSINNTPVKFAMLVEAALPVQLVSFSAKKQGNTAVLNWSTADEINNAGFDVEKSVDGVKFSKIGFVKGAGRAWDYEFTDENLVETAYYRLKQVDFNGNFEYSKIVSIAATTSALKARVTPTVATDYIVVELDAKSMKQPKVEIVNTVGKVVYQQQGEDTNNISISSLAKGIYFVRVTDGLSTFTQKVVKN